MANRSKKREQRVILAYDVDINSVKQLATINDQIERKFDDIAKAVKRGGVAGAQEFSRLSKESKELERELRDVSKAFDGMDDVPPMLRQATSEMERLNKQIKTGTGSIRDFDDEASKIRQQTGILGDVGGATRGIAPVFQRIPGLAGAETGLAVLAEVPDSLEAIGNLRPAIAGTPDAIKSVATSLGATGLGLGAVALVAVGAFGFLSKGIRDSAAAAKEYAEQQAQNAQTFADITQLLQKNDLEAVGNIVLDTTNRLENAQIKLSQLEEQRTESLIRAVMEVDNISREAAEQIVNTIPLDQLRDRASSWQFTNLGIDKSANQAIDTFQALDDQIRDLHKGELADLHNEFASQRTALAEYNLTLFDAIDAVNQATEVETERSTAILQQAELIKQRSLQEAALLEQSSEQLEDRLQSIEEERIAIGESIDFLRRQAEQTEETTQAIADYNAQLDRLSQEQEFINTQALQTAKNREIEIENESRLQKLAEDRMAAQEELTALEEQSLQERTELEKRYADDLIEISKRATEASEKALRDLQNKLSDLNKSLVRDTEKAQRDSSKKELEARIEAQQKETDLLRDHTRNLEDIRRDANEQELQLSQSRNFRAIFNLRRNTRQRIQDEQRNLSRSVRDQNEENARARQDRLRQFQQERQERLIKFNQDIQDTRNKYNQERVLAQQDVMNTIALRRQQYAQELSDLQMKQQTELALRRGTMNQEMQMLSSLAAFASDTFNRISSLANSGFGSFASGTSNWTSTSTTSNTVNAPITVNAAPNQSAAEVGAGTGNIIQAMLT